MSHSFSPGPFGRSTIHTVEDGQARQILYGAGYFDYGDSGLKPSQLGDLGFAGFRVLDSQSAPTDWLAFQGASYFRSSGQDGQYGASARVSASAPAAPRRRSFPASASSGWRRMRAASPSSPCWTGRPSPAPTVSRR
ncbi:MAG: glucan biosynthesis protein [Alphaproteobacteria bacterium]|nr:glucan biosynthesis protein [Alphaproteobacteria bacterium]